MRVCKLIHLLWVCSAFFLMLTGCKPVQTNMKETYAYTFRNPIPKAIRRQRPIWSLPGVLKRKPKAE